MTFGVAVTGEQKGMGAINTSKANKEAMVEEERPMIEMEQDIKNLEQFETVRAKLRLPPDTKPCIAVLLGENSSQIVKGNIAFIVACELFRIGRTKKQIERILEERWVKLSKVQNVIRSISTGKYGGYGCPRVEVLGLCLFSHRSKCWWHQQIPKVSQQHWKERDFWRYQWPQILHLAPSMLYLAIREVEMRRRIHPGSCVFISWDELVRVSGVSRPTIPKGLMRLREVGLIQYRKGQRRKAGAKGLATIIRRIIPLPKPDMVLHTTKMESLEVAEVVKEFTIKG